MNRSGIERVRFNAFLFVSTFARALIEIFISLYLYKNGFSLQAVLGFYLLENLFSLFVSYYFVLLGEKYNYSVVMYMGIVAFVVLQLTLNHLVLNGFYIVLISLLYALYRRGYWVARRYYITEIMPQRESSEPYSIVLVVSEVASIAAGFLGGLLLDGFNAIALTSLSSVLLVISVVPLLKIRKQKKGTKIELTKYLKKYDKRNYVAFSLYEINNLLSFLFPIFIMLYIKDTYVMAGAVNAISSLAIILFILLYGKIIKKKNYFVISSVLFILICVAKLWFLDYFVLVLCFVEGAIKKMQSQSVNKIYFENRKGMDLAHYNLVYQIVEAVARIIAVLPLFLISDVRMMIMVVLLIIGVELVVYGFLRKNERLQ